MVIHSIVWQTLSRLRHKPYLQQRAPLAARNNIPALRRLTHELQRRGVHYMSGAAQVPIGNWPETPWIMHRWRLTGQLAARANYAEC